jgi:WD40 repeat protein
MDVEFSPTGEELVSGSYDRTVRLWSRMKGHSRYVTGLLQLLHFVVFSIWEFVRSLILEIFWETFFIFRLEERIADSPARVEIYTIPNVCSGFSP